MTILEQLNKESVNETLKTKQALRRETRKYINNVYTIIKTDPGIIHMFH